MKPDPRNYFDGFDTFYDPDKYSEFNKQSRNIYENNYAETTSRMTGTTRHKHAEGFGVKSTSEGSVNPTSLNINLTKINLYTTARLTLLILNKCF